MTKKPIILYTIILVLVLLLIWQWISKGALNNQIETLQKFNNQLSLLADVGPYKSAHLHADVKVYVNGQPIDFSQHKYQLTTSFIHFEEGIGDVIHTHAAGLTVGHMVKSVGMNVNNNCLVIDGNDYCNDGNKRLKFYVNGKQNEEFDNYVIKDLDKMLISFGAETEEEIQKQMSSVTNLASKYSINK